MAAYAQTRGVEFESWVALAPDFRFRLWNAGHILGSASIELEAGTTRLLFSGDIGPYHKAFHPDPTAPARSEEHTSELQSLMRISYAVFCLKKHKHKNTN